MNLYDLAYSIGGVTLAPFWARKQRQGWDERFGKITPLDSDDAKPRLLLHAVSVGEVNALKQLIPMLTPSASVVLSVSTDTGIAQARKIFEPMGVVVVRYPLDFSWAVSRFLDAVRPDAVGLVELEVWPNFIAACGRRGVPVGVINGRLSEKSFRGYRKARFALKRTFASLAFAAVQDEAYAQRFVAMGTPTDRVRVTDTMKWDTAVVGDDSLPPAALNLRQQLGIDASKPLIVAGSTAEGEEQLLHAACPPGVQLLCAPRKPERFDDAASAMPGCVRRSWTVPDTTARRPPPGLGTTKSRFLLDTLGELRAAYALADIAVIGRSFGTGQGGGSDPIEPIALGKPTLIGPDFANFTTVVDALRKSGGLSIVTPGELRVTLAALLNDRAKRMEMARKGRACIRERQADGGATARHAAMLLNMLPRR